MTDLVILSAAMALVPLSLGIVRDLLSNAVRTYA